MSTKRGSFNQLRGRNHLSDGSIIDSQSSRHSGFQLAASVLNHQKQGSAKSLSMLSAPPALQVNSKPPTASLLFSGDSFTSLSPVDFIERGKDDNSKLPAKMSTDSLASLIFHPSARDGHYDVQPSTMTHKSSSLPAAKKFFDLRHTTSHLPSIPSEASSTKESQYNFARRNTPVYRSISQADISPSSPSQQGTTPKRRVRLGFLYTYAITQVALLLVVIGIIGAAFVLREMSATTRHVLIGMIIGGFLMYAVLYYYTWLLDPTIVTVQIPPIDLYEHELPEEAVQFLPRNSNESREEAIYIYQGWMNLLEGQEYLPERYHISNTETVFVKLDGTKLIIKKPLESDIPKRAAWNEPTHNVTFVKQIQIDVRNFLVECLPQDLSEKHVYSKRYPICLTNKLNVLLPKKDTQTESLFEKFHVGARRSPEAIVLFARTHKEKEDWFKRLEQASKGCPISTLVTELQRMATSIVTPDDPKINDNLNVNGADQKGRRRSWSDSAKYQGASLKKKWQNLYERDHRVLLADYMMYMTNAMCKSGSVEPPDTAKTFVQKTIAQSPNQLHPSPHRDKSRTSVSPTRITSGFSGFFSTKSPTSQTSPPSVSSKSPPANNETPVPVVSISDCDTGTLWVNALIQRVFFDVFHEEYWALRVQSKIQKKLNKISVPYYLDPFVIGEVHLGSGLPLIKRISQPYLSDDGMWFDCDIIYNGGAHMSIETKINLNALKRESLSTNANKPSAPEHNKKGPAISDCDSDSSDESSSDSESKLKIPTPLAKDPKKGEHTLTKIFNSLKTSKYFQRLAKTKLIKSAMDKVSNTKLCLTVEVKFLAGMLSVNIAPPPTDRIWFGFRGPPHLVLTTKPVIGAKSVNLTKVTSWIEQKLTAEFCQEMVLPNMNCVKIKLMVGTYGMDRSSGSKLNTKPVKKSVSSGQLLTED